MIGSSSPNLGLQDTHVDPSKTTILVVDDDKVVTQMLHRWLAEAGYKCVVATTAEEGWARLQDPANDITLVITDASMPGEYDGFGLVDRIMKLKEELGINVIMMSGQSKDTAVKGVSLGSNDFMPKPLIKQLLLRKVEILLQHRASKLELRKERLEKEELRKEIATLSERVNRPPPSFETPIQTISSSITALLNQQLPGDVREQLLKLRNITLHASNLYRPMTSVEENPDFDAVTKSFLKNEFALTLPSDGDDSLKYFGASRIDGTSTEDLMQWSFNVFERSEDELLALAKQMFVHLDLLNIFDIKAEVLERFLVVVRKNYNANPYHNWRHAFDVTQATFSFLTHFEAHKLLTSLDCLALLVASLCHDLGHPGVNNAFMINTSSDLAILYNDMAVLENFHAASLFQLIHQHPELNIFSSLTKQKFREVRKLIVECIIATDPSIHYEYVSKLSAKVQSDKKAWNRESPEERLLLMKSIIKMADISNVARLWDGAGFVWSQRVSEEFFDQGDREKSLGYDVAAFMDREATTVYKNSMNFIDFVAAPLFKNLGVLHSDFDEQVVSLLTLNRERWEIESRKHAEAQAQAQTAAKQ